MNMADTCLESLEDSDLDLVARSVSQEVEQMITSLTIKQGTLQNVQGRVSALQGTLLDQGAKTIQALMSAFQAKLRLCEAERAISRARGAVQLTVADEKSIAKQERDVARGTASQLKLHVEVLTLFQGDGLGKMLQDTYSRLEDSLHLMSSELTDLVEHHRTLLAMLSTQNKVVLPETIHPPDKKLQLEAHWMLMSSNLDKLKTSTVSKLIPSSISSENQSLLSETQAYSDYLHQLCLEIEQTSLLIDDKEKY